MLPKELKFCKEYMSGCSACEAARRAGYSEQTSLNASRWLDARNTKTYKPKLAEYIQTESAKIDDARIAKPEEIRDFFTSVMRNPEEATKDRIKAGELLAKIQGQFIERVDVTGQIPVVISGEEELTD